MNIKTTAALLSCSLISLSAQAATEIFVDFGNASISDISSWNNFSKDSGVAAFDETIANLIDSNGTSTGFSLQADFENAGVNDNGVSTDTVSPFNTGTATRDSFYMIYNEAGSPTGLLTLSGLDAGSTYSFDFYAARSGSGDPRITDYTVIGGNKTDTTSLNAYGNTNNVATSSNYTANEFGVITIDVELADGNTEYGYFGTMRITTAVIPEPGAFAFLLGASGFACVMHCRRRKA